MAIRRQILRIKRFIPIFDMVSAEGKEVTERIVEELFIIGYPLKNAQRLFKKEIVPVI
jgi:hypothetical protein